MLTSRIVKLRSCYRVCAAAVLVLTPVALAQNERQNDGIDVLKRGEVEIAIAELTPRAESGEARAQVALGASLLIPGPNLDFKRAYFWLTKAAAQEIPEAMFLVGNMLLSGRGVSKNAKKAAELFKKSAERGFGRSQASLGRLYWEGRGVPQDDTESVKWYTRAAEHGNLNAYMALAQATGRGAGTLRDPVEAFKWWSLAGTWPDPQMVALSEAAKKRLMLGSKDIAKGQQAVREWQEKYGATVDPSPVFVFEKQ